MIAILSHYQAKVLLDSRQQNRLTAEVSLDLGLTLTLIELELARVYFPEGGYLSWESVEAIAADENGCYILEGDEAHKIQFYSELTDRAYSLYPTSGAPTMLVSGIPMHRIKDTDPYQDTLEKIRAAKPVGNVLDTATGLGYTAVEAAKTALHVTTIELDPTALKVARLNPWSQALFNSTKITQVIGDSFEKVQEFDDGAFTRIIHDPPAFSLAGDLYALDFYRELYRLLSRNGRLFHYIGDPESKSGRNITASAVRRLQQAGFRQVARAPRAFGLIASK
jgi:predicted methyltransferase